MVLIDQGLQCLRDYPISFRQGDTVEETIAIVDVAGNPVDTAGYSARIVAIDQNGDIVLDGTETTILALASGSLSLLLDEADTYDIDEGVYTYEIKLTSLTNTWTISAGTMRVIATAIPEGV